MEEKNYEVGDLVQVKKPHPCGSKVWEILYLGADVRLKCQGCGHLIMVPRAKFNKMVKGNCKERYKGIKTALIINGGYG